jgi:tetratricopeptide (TPR) repeat protein
MAGMIAEPLALWRPASAGYSDGRTPYPTREGFPVSHLLAGFVAVALAAPADAPDDKLKAAALALNQAANLDAALDAANKLLRPKADAKKLARLAADMQREAEKRPPFKYTAAFALGKLAQLVKEYDAAEALYESCVSNARQVGSKTKMLEVQTELADLYFDQRKWAESGAATETALAVAQELLREAEELRDDSRAPAFGRLLLLYERLIQTRGLKGDTDAALAEADRLMGQFAKIAAYFRPLRAGVLSEAGRHAEAVKEMQKFLNTADSLADVFREEAVANLKRNAKYRMSGFQVDAGDVDAAVATLRDLLEDNPTSATFHNDLGFVLADHDRDLDEAEALCRKALELDAEQRKKLAAEEKLEPADADRENAAYLDSLGWVLFKKGKSADALPYLKKAADDEDGNHLEIWDHLADCLMKLGQKDKAVATWEKALTFDDISKRDVDRRKKVSAKLKAAKK